MQYYSETTFVIARSRTEETGRGLHRHEDHCEDENDALSNSVPPYLQETEVSLRKPGKE